MRVRARVKTNMIYCNDLLKKTMMIRESVLEKIISVVDSGRYILGNEVERFESAFAEYIGTSYCVTVGNGTDALEIGLRAMGVEAGDRVATVANAGMYTSTAINIIGATPVFMDVELSTACVSLDAVKKVIAQGVKVVVITHLYGFLVPEIESIAQYCKEQNVLLLEDSSQAHGAKVSGRCAGSFGDLGVFSFYPTKNLGAFGDGGGIVTSSDVLINKITKLRQYGWEGKYVVTHDGGRNSRMDEMQAAILSVQLPLLDQQNRRRREIASYYNESVSNPALRLPGHGGENYVAHLYVLQSDYREQLQQHLSRCGIGSDVHYPIADHCQPTMRERFFGVQLLNTEQLAETVLSIPCYPEMTQAECGTVAQALNAFVV